MTFGRRPAKTVTRFVAALMAYLQSPLSIHFPLLLGSRRNLHTTDQSIQIGIKLHEKVTREPRNHNVQTGERESGRTGDSHNRGIVEKTVLAGHRTGWESPSVHPSPLPARCGCTRHTCPSGDPPLPRLQSLPPRCPPPGTPPGRGEPRERR